MFDIILIQPPLFQIDEGMVNPIEMAYWNTMNKYSGKLLGDLPVEGSWGILSIGNYLIERGFKVKILYFHLIDFTLRKTEKRRISEIEILHYLKLYKSSFWGISVFTIADNWANIITNMIRKFQQDSYIFWGGYYPTENDEILVKKNSNIDFIVRNEGEETVYEIVSHFKKK